MPPINLTGNSKFVITLGTIIALVGASAGAAYKAQSTLTDIRDSVREVNDKVASLERSTSDRFDAIDLVMADRWTRTSAAEWALRLKLANPQLAIPDPRDPSKLLSY